MSLMRCPLCREALTREPRRWFCATGHSFDVAREGYVNLLPVQHKKSRDPGDTPDSARRHTEAGAALPPATSLATGPAENAGPIEGRYLSNPGRLASCRIVSAEWSCWKSRQRSTINFCNF